MLNLPPGAFKTMFEAMKTYLFNPDILTSKTIMEGECDGEKLADLLETCVESLNKDNGVDIPNAHDVVVERFCRRLAVQLASTYSKEIPESSVLSPSLFSSTYHLYINIQLTGEEAKLLEKHTSVRITILESFNSQTSGFTSDRVKQCRDDLEEKINKEHELLTAKNKLLQVRATPHMRVQDAYALAALSHPRIAFPFC
jgi:hypothetical protein